MDDKLLVKLLTSKKELDWLEFKQKWEIYDAKGKVVPHQRDEFIKDILGLANGNSHIVRETNYLIIGADNKKFDDNGRRLLYNVDYGVPTQSELATWLRDTCSPAIVGLKCECYPFDGFNLFIVTIHATFDLHETTRELNGSGHFQKHTVFMRQDEHTVPASVRDGITIQERKHQYRQEVANPPSEWLGALVGGIVTLLLWGAESKVIQSDPGVSRSALGVIAVLAGAFLGSQIGSFTQEIDETRYSWRYWTNKKRAQFALLLLAIGAAVYFLFLRG